MARGKIDIYIRIDRQEKKILKMKEDLEKAQDEYEELIREKEDKEKETLYANVIQIRMMERELELK